MRFSLGLQRNGRWEGWAGPGEGCALVTQENRKSLAPFAQKRTVLSRARGAVFQACRSSSMDRMIEGEGSKAKMREGGGEGDGEGSGR